MTKKSQPLFSPHHTPSSMNESIGNTTVGEAIARNHHMLWDHFFDPLLELDDHVKLLEDIRAVIGDPALQAELETRWRNEDSQLSEEVNILLQDVRYACLYLELARAAETNNDRDRAWAFTCYASVMTGEISEKSAVVINTINKNARSTQNSKNAKARAEKYLPAKEEVVRLLEKLKPAGGWTSFRGAAIALEEDIIEFILKTHPPILSTSNILNTLEREWLPKDEFINSAWTKTAAVNIRK
ncbi:hypothetical protein ALQ72_00470 [Pseudomonas syringae pv. maculicola]|uniref:hypothetical protein n=1 Tax=Pseudomonas syringae group genomosp. 3 TaxID=251701 RepID=UPI0006B9FB07|nr:hypothetical protein [Pseudomonas syringae group genomosp. 3]MBM0211279.1 hypothetical protein [Pseudomonas syringae pv. maculicola]RMM70822.1 hypothetical protein ALQ72_00470 [Pseudomonas syringae pv. maculicola]